MHFEEGNLRKEQSRMIDFYITLLMFVLKFVKCLYLGSMFRVDLMNILNHVYQHQQKISNIFHSMFQSSLLQYIYQF